jgi:hypothetical protein
VFPKIILFSAAIRSRKDRLHPSEIPVNTVHLVEPRSFFHILLPGMESFAAEPADPRQLGASQWPGVGSGNGRGAGNGGFATVKVDGKALCLSRYFYLLSGYFQADGCGCSAQMSAIEPPKFDLESYIGNYSGMFTWPTFLRVGHTSGKLILMCSIVLIYLRRVA